MYFYHAPAEYFGAGLITTPAPILRFSEDAYPDHLKIHYLHVFPTIQNGEITYASVTLTALVSRRVNGMDFKNREVRLITFYCGDDHQIRGKIIDREGKWYYLDIQMVAE